MIILDDEDQQHPKLQPPGVTPSRPANVLYPPRSLSPRPPSYESSQADTSSDREFKAKRLAGKRLWKATLWALTFYIALTLIVGMRYIVSRLDRRHPMSHGWWDHIISKPPSRSAQPVKLPSNGSHIDFGLYHGKAMECDSWHLMNGDILTMYRSASLQYRMPLEGIIHLGTNTTWKLGERNLLNGTVSLGINPDETAKDAIVSATMHYHNDAIRSVTHVCLMRITDGWGLSIFTPENLTIADGLRFDIALQFPQLPWPHLLENLDIKLPMLEHSFADFGHSISFGKITIEAPSVGVDIASVTARDVLVKTSFADIRGAFNITNSIILDNMAGEIHANITLSSPEKRKAFTQVMLSTGNGAINSNITLTSKPMRKSLLRSITHHTPQFYVNAHTFNAPLDLSIDGTLLSDPVMLDIHAAAQLGQATVSLDNSFQGTFDVWTQFATANVTLVNNSTGEVVPVTNESFNAIALEKDGRRIVFDQVTAERLVGWFGFGADTSAGPFGFVEVASSLAPAILKFIKP